MIGKLLDVFEVTGRGTVVAIDVLEGDCRIGDQLQIGARDWPITGIEMVTCSLEGLRRLEEGWVPPRGILPGGATKADLVLSVGQECRVVGPKDTA